MFSSGHGPPRETNRKLAAVASANRLSIAFSVAFVRTFGRRATRSKIEPFRMSRRAVTQRLIRVSSFGRRTSAAMTPSAAITIASSEGLARIGTVERSQRSKATSNDRRSPAWVRRRFRVLRRLIAPLTCFARSVILVSRSKPSPVQGLDYAIPCHDVAKSYGSKRCRGHNLRRLCVLDQASHQIATKALALVLSIGSGVLLDARWHRVHHRRYPRFYAAGDAHVRFDRHRRWGTSFLL